MWNFSFTYFIGWLFLPSGYIYTFLLSYPGILNLVRLT